VGTVTSGTENNAILSITVRAVQAGVFHGSACAVGNYERFDASNCADYDITITGTSTPQAPTLALTQSSYGLYQLQLTGQQNVNYQIQTSTDLQTWLSWTNAIGPLFYLQLPNLAKPATKPTFYRARWP
jgi:hypothetical protein